jgi:hypothetical protein
VPVLTSRYDAVLKSICSIPGELSAQDIHCVLSKHGGQVCTGVWVAQVVQHRVCRAHIAQSHGTQQTLWQLLPRVALSTGQPHRPIRLATLTAHFNWTRTPPECRRCAHGKPRAGVFEPVACHTAFDVCLCGNHSHARSSCPLWLQMVSAPAAGCPCPRPRTWRRR